MRRRSTPAPALLLTAAVFVVSVVAAPVSGAQDAEAGEDAPTIVVVLGSGASEGEELVIAGDGWGPSTMLAVTVCGNRGEAPGLDCVSQGPRFSSTPDGSMVYETTLVNPPASCPCVVHVRSVDSAFAAEASVPLAIEGIEARPEPPVVDPDPVVEPEPGADTLVVEAPLIVESVTVTGGGWRSWLGLANDRTLEVVVRNPNENDVGGLTMGFAWGRGPQPDNVVDVPLLGGIGAGDSVSLRRTFTVEMPAYGSYEIEGVIGRGLGSTSFDASFTTWPWAVIVLFAGLLIGSLRPLVPWIAKLRRRFERPAPAPAATSPELDVALREALVTHVTGRLDRLSGVALSSEERQLIAQDAGVDVVSDVLARVHLTSAEMNALAEHAVAEIMTALDDLYPEDAAEPAVEFAAGGTRNGSG